MNALEAINAIYQEKLVECTKEEYEKEIRSIIQEQAGKWIDSGHGVRATIALEEVKRLDKKFELPLT